MQKWLRLYFKRRHKGTENLNWPEIPVYPYRILIIGFSGNEKANALSNLISQEPDIDKMYL